MKTEQFLDMQIITCDNNDGIVLKVDNYHCGNFTKIDQAKLYALRWFIMLRPETFGEAVINKMSKNKSGTMHEWYLFTKRLEGEGYEIPEGCEPINGLNMLIGYKGIIV